MQEAVELSTRTEFGSSVGAGRDIGNYTFTALISLRVIGVTNILFLYCDLPIFIR